MRSYSRRHHSTSGPRLSLGFVCFSRRPWRSLRFLLCIALRFEVFVSLTTSIHGQVGSFPMLLRNGASHSRHGVDQCSDVVVYRVLLSVRVDQRLQSFFRSSQRGAATERRGGFPLAVHSGPPQFFGGFGDPQACIRPSRLLRPHTASALRAALPVSLSIRCPSTGPSALRGRRTDRLAADLLRAVSPAGYSSSLPFGLRHGW